MLAEVAREADELTREIEREAEPPVAEIEVECLGMLLLDAVLGPTPDLGREGAGHVVGQAEHLADFAHGAAGAVADHGGAQGRAVAAVMLVDPLDHPLALLVLEIDVDVRRLGALGGDEALEQQPGLRRVDAGDAEHVADG